MRRKYVSHKKLKKNELYNEQVFIPGAVAPKLSTELHEILAEDELKHVLKKQKEEKSNKVVLYKLKLVGNVFLIFIGCLFLMGQYASITFNQKEIKNLKSQLKGIQNTNATLKSEIAESIDLTFIKQKAMGKLGMVEPAPHQIVYIDIPKVSYTAYYQPPMNEPIQPAEEDVVAASFFDFFNWKE
ncbi:septum formation initiator family protein [Defluviitalea saccharophila]|uniref:Septum formation initiator family protein n=1 Tax=Defluviitalea saccharophila TaxID=879970 RepID=A0ABZ2Y4B2_9FIRM